MNFIKFKFHGLQAHSLPNNDISKLLMTLPDILRPVVQLLKDPDMHSDEMIIKNAVQAMDTIEIVKSDELIRLIFGAISKYVKTARQHLFYFANDRYSYNYIDVTFIALRRISMEIQN